MYVVVVNHKLSEPLQDLLPELRLKFPQEVFSIHGTPDKGYKLHIEGMGDEKLPRVFSEKFLKKWKPKSSEVLEIKITDIKCE